MTTTTSAAPTTPLRVVWCGVGALGSSAVVLCRNFAVQHAFIDFDRVESKNLLAQAYVKQSLGKNKAEALKGQLLTFYGVKCEAFGVRLTRENTQALLGDAGLLVDCFDNATSRQIVSDFARERGLPLLHAAVSGDGTFGLVRWDERFVADAEATPGAPTCEGGEHLPMIGALASTLARTIQDFMKTGARRDSMVGLQSVTPTS